MDAVIELLVLTAIALIITGALIALSDGPPWLGIGAQVLLVFDFAALVAIARRERRRTP